ncbi:MAG: hypothetical protein ACPGGK_15735, partial [Pikeienuella sp.]
MAGLTPMMFAASINFGAVGEGFAALFAGGLFTGAGWSAFTSTVLSIGAPTALWWKQLATAVVFGLGVSTVLTLLITPTALALRVWVMEHLFRRCGPAHCAFAVLFYPLWFGRKAYAQFKEDVRLYEAALSTRSGPMEWVSLDAYDIEASGPQPIANAAE